MPADALAMNRAREDHEKACSELLGFSEIEKIYLLIREKNSHCITYCSEFGIFFMSDATATVHEEWKLS